MKKRPVPRREPDDATTKMMEAIHRNRENFSVEKVAAAFKKALKERKAMSPENTLLVAHCQEEGGGTYSDYTEMPDGDLCCINRFAFTYAILSGLNHCGYEDRWCYSSYEKCEEALRDWKEHFATQKEPTGWHRHPSTGRRRDKEGVETINW